MSDQHSGSTSAQDLGSEGLRPNPEEIQRALVMQGIEAGVDRIEAADLVIVGSGIAGLTAAITAAKNLQPGQRIALVTKTEVGSGGSSPWAQGGIAAAVGGVEDAVEHAEDTVRVGRELCDAEIVQQLTAAGDEAIERLVELGVRFDRAADGSLLLGREGGHHRRRVLHANGDATGKEIMRALRQAFVDILAEHPQVSLEERLFAEDLLIVEGPGNEAPRCVGLLGSRFPSADEPAAERVALAAPRVLLATGGMGQLFRYTTNPVEVTGDGIAMAARAGAVLADMEMMQFHPTTLAVDEELNTTGKEMLLTEALRGEGAYLLDEDGHRFMTAVHELGELAPRDVVARTLWQRSAAGLSSYLDLRPVQEALVEASSRLAERFPTAYKQCKSVGLDPLREPLPITPAAHYTMGGVWTDEQGRTSIVGLWAVGEVASSGVHGANRLASNSLLEGAVFGHEFTVRMLAAPPAVGAVTPAQLADNSAEWRLGDTALQQSVAVQPGRPVVVSDPALRLKIRERMWQSAGLVRNAVGLTELERELSILERFRSEPGLEERNLLLLGRLLCRAALARTESRGGHYRSDFPQTDPAQARRNRKTAAQLLGQSPARSMSETAAQPMVSASW